MSKLDDFRDQIRPLQDALSAYVKYESQWNRHVLADAARHLAAAAYELATQAGRGERAGSGQ